MDWVGLLIYLCACLMIFLSGANLGYNYHKRSPKFAPEYIIASAILLNDYEDAPNGGPYRDSSYRTALRHHIIYRDHNDVSRKPQSQGFVTNQLRFVSREEAAEIAYKAGQIKEHVDKLFSEDLW